MAKTFEAKTVGKIETEKLFSPNRPKFIFMHHGDQWDLIETSQGWELLPMLTQFQLMPGLNGVRHSPGGGIDSGAARASFMDQGWTFLANDTAGPDGYLREYAGASGSIFVDKWCSPRKLGNGKRAKVIWESDLDGYNDYRRSLLESGRIAQPDPNALDFKIALLEKRIGRKIKNAHIPAIAKEIEKAVAKKEAIETAKATKKTTAPKRKRAPRKVKADV